jgi:hypothetical protein
MRVEDRLLSFLSRMLGWANPRGVEIALRSIALAEEQQAALALCGPGDIVQVAWALHRRAWGTRPFIVSDPRRASGAATVRSPANRPDGVSALAAAVGGTLCVRAERLPNDFADLCHQLRGAVNVVFMVCLERDELGPLLARPAPIVVPPIAGRTAELDRIIDEYVIDAIAEFDAPPDAFTPEDRVSVRRHATTLAEIEKATLRLVALRSSPSLERAAERLGMSTVSLTRWLNRRR